MKKNTPNSMHFDQFRLEFNHILLQFESSDFNFVTIGALSTVSSHTTLYDVITTQMTSWSVRQKIKSSLCFKFFNFFFFHAGQGSNNCTGIFLELFGDYFLVLPRFQSYCSFHGWVTKLWSGSIDDIFSKIFSW